MFMKCLTLHWRGSGKVLVRLLTLILVFGLHFRHMKHVVQGHKSSLAFGLIGEGTGIPVVAMLGRVRKIFERLHALVLKHRQLVPSL